jgi:hypothetical protein
MSKRRSYIAGAKVKLRIDVADPWNDIEDLTTQQTRYCIAQATQLHRTRVSQATLRHRRSMDRNCRLSDALNSLLHSTSEQQHCSNLDTAMHLQRQTTLNQMTGIRVKEKWSRTWQSRDNAEATQERCKSDSERCSTNAQTVYCRCDDLTME